MRKASEMRTTVLRFVGINMIAWTFRKEIGVGVSRKARSREISPRSLIIDSKYEACLLGKV